MFKLLLDNRIFFIPSKILFLSDVGSNIIDAIQKDNKYYIESDVNESVLQSFVDHWMNKKIPDILISNFDQYYQLSQEFDRMKNLIQLYKKITSNYAIFSLMRKNQALKEKMQQKKKLLKQKEEKYQQVIQSFFNNNNAYPQSKFTKIKGDIEEENRVGLLARNTILLNNILYVLNEEEKTASVFRCYQAEGDVFIPKFVMFNLCEYLVTSICEAAFLNVQNLKSILFPDDSQLGVICPFAFSRSSIERIRIPSHVTEIGRSAFSDCNKLETVDFSEDSELKSFKEQIFSYSSIKSLTIPSNLEILENEWCLGTPNLNEIKVSSKNKVFANYEEFVVGKSDKSEENYNVLYFANRNIFCAKIPSFIENIAPYSFHQCSELDNVYFPNNSKLKLIGHSSFSLASLKDISIPSQVVKISGFAFVNCQQLQKVEFKEDSQLKTIGEFAFSDSLLKSISFPDHLKYIGQCAFSGCEELQTAVFPENSEYKIFGKSLFSKSSLNSLSIPSSLEEFEDDWCHEISDLNNIKITQAKASNITYYDNKYLLGKLNLKSMNYDVLLFARRDIQHATIPSFIKKISNHAFSGCMKLECVEFLEDSELNEICYYSFAYCPIKKIKIPPSVTKIGGSSFFMSSLECLEFSQGSKLNSIGSYAFCYCPIQSITLPSSFDGFEKSWCFGVRSLKNINIYHSNEENIMYYDDSFILGKSDKKSDIFDIIILSRRNIKNIVIPSFIKYIAPYAFSQCQKIESIEFSKNSQLQIIDDYAFSFSFVEEILIPKTVTYINDNAFCNCDKLRIIKFEKESELKFIGKSAFYSTSLKSFLIPKNVRKIPNAAFSSCNELLVIEIPEKSKLNLIDKKAFKYSKLELIFVPPRMKEIIP